MLMVEQKDESLQIGMAAKVWLRCRHRRMMRLTGAVEVPKINGKQIAYLRMPLPPYLRSHTSNRLINLGHKAALNQTKTSMPGVAQQVLKVARMKTRSAVWLDVKGRAGDEQTHRGRRGYLG